MGKNQGVIEHDIKIGNEIIQECKVLLTDDELLDRGKKLAQAVAETNQTERDKAAYNSQIKSRLDIANGLTQKFRGIVAEGAEYRPVVCHRVYDYTDRTVSVVRDDTAETVEYRPMEAHELQRHLDLNSERPVTQEAEDALFGDDDQTDEDGEE